MIEQMEAEGVVGAAGGMDAEKSWVVADRSEGTRDDADVRTDRAAPVEQAWPPRNRRWRMSSGPMRRPFRKFRRW